MIRAKVEGKQVVEAPQSQELAPVIDIMEALKASLALGKKPPRSVSSASAASAEEAESGKKTKRAKKSATGD
jgi:DNA end-binding protein Ku